MNSAASVEPTRTLPWITTVQRLPSSRGYPGVILRAAPKAEEVARGMLVMASSYTKDTKLNQAWMQLQASGSWEGRKKKKRKEKGVETKKKKQ